MKNFQVFVSIFTLALLFGCNNPDSNNSDMNNESVDTAIKTDSSAQNMAVDNDTSSTRLIDMVGMYQDIGLTEDQIDKFEEDYKRKVDALKSQGRGDYDTQSIEATKDQSMRTVTTDDEFQRYLEWKKNNPVEY